MEKAKKSLSQNFLIDKNICIKILKNLEIKNKIVLEIGPGYGFLTDNIIEMKPKKLIIIEKDYNLITHLKAKYINNNKIEIVEGDILKFDLSNFKNLLIVSNLPYNISTKIILYLFNFSKNIKEMVFMLQKEVADKFNYNSPEMNKYKFFTKILSTFLICFNVSPHVFKPKPKVWSSVVKFKFKKNNIDLDKANTFSKSIFKNVRKKINNNLKLNKYNKLLNQRVNEISIDDLLRIYNLF